MSPENQWLVPMYFLLKVRPFLGVKMFVFRGCRHEKHGEPHFLKVSVSIYNPAYNKDFHPKLVQLQRLKRLKDCIPVVILYSYWQSLINQTCNSSKVVPGPISTMDHFHCWNWIRVFWLSQARHAEDFTKNLQWIFVKWSRKGTTFCWLSTKESRITRNLCFLTFLWEWAQTVFSKPYC